MGHANFIEQIDHRYRHAWSDAMDAIQRLVILRESVQPVKARKTKHRG